MVPVSLYKGALLLSLLIFANTQNVCQDGPNTIIGSDNRQEYEVEERVGGRLYLNTDNPARCSGFITQLEYCYYPPDNELQTFYHVYFAIYRREFNRQRNVRYQLQQRVIPLSGFVNGVVAGLDDEFSCTTLSIISAIRIQKGDIIGACLPRINSLDVVSNISDEEEDEEGLNANLHYIESDCGHIFAVPLTTDVCNTKVQESRILHLYATINTGGRIPSESEPPTPPPVSDCPQTIPDNNISIAMSNPSQLSSTSSLIGGQPSISIVTPIAATSTATIASIQSTTSISTETSVRDQISITPTSTAPMVSTTNRTLTSTREPDLTTTPMFITQSSTVVLLVPVSTTRTAVSTSTEQSSPGQSVTVSSSSESTMTPSGPQSVTVSSSSESTTTLPGPQNLERGSLSTAATVVIVLVIIALVVLTAALIGILTRKYRKRRYRYYPAFKHTILEEDESAYSQTGTIARFDNVFYSNYTETVQIQDARKPARVYDYCDSSTNSPEPRPIESTYSEVQEEVDSDSYSYAVISGEFHAPAAEANSRLPERRPYDPNRESLLSVFCAPASKESDLYAQLKLCGIKSIRRDTIEATERLGSGQFGDVKKGIWRNEKLKVPVALKTLKEGSEQVDKVKFLQEAAIMAQFSHPNVAVLYGVVSKGEPIMLVVELVEKGNLLDYLAFLKENNDSVHLPNLPNILLNFSRQVSLGMCYLSEKGFVHRDLAARNILVSNDDICKIADFGMSRDLADENYYVSHGGKIPVKWTAPEAINYKKYSTASDVWSYGCLLYEIWSLGHKPYENLSNLQVIRRLELGQRLSPPPGCPRKIYEIMIFCWNPEVALRPKFSDLALILVGDRKEVLAVPQEDLATHPLAGVLGAALDAGEGMYLDLQNRYVFN